MREPRIPVFLAVGFWAASGLAVLTYTLTALKETATDAEEVLLQVTDPLVASASVIAANAVGGEKKLNRNKFDPSPEALFGLLRDSKHKR